MTEHGRTWEELGIDTRGRNSGEVYTQCPWCSDARKKKRATCLSANLDKGVFVCHHCGVTGSLKDGKRNPAAMHWQRPAYRKPEPRPQPELPEDVIAWFSKRGISPEILIRNHIGFGMIYMPQVEEEVRAINFPYFRGDDLINRKWRDAEKNFRLETGAERILYGLNNMAETTILVEGEMDCLSIQQAGFTSCVSVPDGAPAENSKDYSSKFTFLDADKEKIEAVNTWILAVDNDGPGKRLEDELTRRLGREKCKRVMWPEGCKDANDVLKRLGPDALCACINEAQPYPIAGVFDIADLSDRVMHLYEHGWEKGKSTGWRNIDKFFTVRPGELTVVTGIPNSGKSAWLDDLLVNLMRDNAWGVGIFSPENQPVEDHLARLTEKYQRTPFHAGPSQRMSEEQIFEALAFLHRHAHLILPDDDDHWTLDVILDAAKALVFRHGIRLLVIDPWNELEHHRPQGVSETEYIGSCLKRIRNFGRRHGVHVFIVAHPAKLYRDSDGNYPVPTMYDISGSAHFRNKADNGICIWRDLADADTNLVQVHVQKIRFRQIGRVGMTELVYNRATGTYHDPMLSGKEINDEHNREFM